MGGGGGGPVEIPRFIGLFLTGFVLSLFLAPRPQGDLLPGETKMLSHKYYTRHQIYNPVLGKQCSVATAIEKEYYVEGPLPKRSRLCCWSYLIKFSIRNLLYSPCCEPSCTGLLPDVMYTMYAHPPWAAPY